MNERPLNTEIVVWSDEGLRTYFDVEGADGQPADLSGWSGFEFLAGDVSAITLTGTVTKETGKIWLAMAEADLKTLFPETGTIRSRILDFVVRATPPLANYRVRLAWGALRINRGLPEAPA